MPRHPYRFRGQVQPSASVKREVRAELVAETDGTTGKLYLHVLDVRQSGGIEAARQSVLDQEERVLRAFASDDELAAAGLSRVRSGRARP